MLCTLSAWVIWAQSFLAWVRARAETRSFPLGSHFMVTIIMKKSIHVTKKSRGRPKTTGPGVQIGMRWQSPELTLIDGWIEKHAPDLSRPEAIRRLVELGLKVKK